LNLQFAEGQDVMQKKPTNVDRLTTAGVIPKGYKNLTDAEKATINKLSDGEVEAITSATSKLDPNFMKKHAPHGMLY
jgi:hypothetical protein